MAPRIVIPETAEQSDRNKIFSLLNCYNARSVGALQYRPLSILLVDEKDNIVGGFWGNLSLDWLFVEALIVIEEFRELGFGTNMVHEAERIARRSKCVGIWLDTYEFQAREFYGKLGFDVFGALENNPRGQKHFFMRKQF